GSHHDRAAYWPCNKCRAATGWSPGLPGNLGTLERDTGGPRGYARKVAASAQTWYYGFRNVHCPLHIPHTGFLNWTEEPLPEPHERWLRQNRMSSLRPGLGPTRQAMDPASSAPAAGADRKECEDWAPRSAGSAGSP